jgi:hypothetical protein
MSFDINAFVRGPQDLGAIADLLRKLGLTLHEYSEGWRAEIFGIHVSASSATDLDDDAGIAFSKYPLLVQFVRSAGESSDERTVLCEVLGKLFARQVVGLGWECVLVEGMQRQISF